MLYRLHHVIPPHILISHVHATQHLTFISYLDISIQAPWLSPEHLLGVFNSPGLPCSGPEAWIEVKPFTKDQPYLSE